MELGTANRVSRARAVWFTAQRTVEIREELLGPLTPSHVRVRVIASAISHGTEMLVYRGEVPPGTTLDLPTLAGSFDFPIKYGYASVGRVEEVGSAVTDLAPGDLAFTLHPHQDTYVVPAALVRRLPPELPPELGLFVANLETAVNALLDAPVRLGEHVVVFGQGVVGLLVDLLAHQNGAGRVIVVDGYERRRRLASALGADAALAPDVELADRIRDLTEGRGADLVFDASGNPAALQAAIGAVAPEGTVVVCSWYGTKSVALELGGHFHRERVRIRSSQVGRLDPGLGPRWNHARRSKTVLDLLPRLSLDRLVSQHFPFERAAEAYRLVDEHPEETVQVVLSYPSA